MALKMLACRGHKPFRPVSSQSVAPQVPNHHLLNRRELLQFGIALPLLASGSARAEDVLEAPEAAVVAPVAESSVLIIDEAAPPAVLAPPPPRAPEPFLDLDFQIVPPSNFKFIDTQPAYDPTRRGPAPEPSPVRARFDSPDGSTVVSVIVRNAQAVKQSLLQVYDISVYGDLEEVAKLLLPRGSKVLSGSTLQVVLPPRQTALGPVAVPPKNYYRYDFTTNNGLHVVMTVAAMKGRVYVCGGTAPLGEPWEEYGEALKQATESFRLRMDGGVL